MSAARDPVRLSDLGSGAAPELADALRSIQAEQGSVEQALALQRRLAAQLGPAAGLGTAVSAIWSWSRLLLLGVALSVLVLTAAKPWARPAASATRVASSARIATPVERERPHEQPQPELPAHSPAHAPQTSAAQAAPPSVRPRPRAARPDAEAELALLQLAQSALGKRPAQALELAERHASVYPNGIFAQEREMIAIGALLKLHQRPAAIARAELFVQRHGDSPHALRVRSLLEHIPDRGTSAR